MSVPKTGVVGTGIGASVMFAAQLASKQYTDIRIDIPAILHDHLPRNRLHEVFAETADAASALAFAQLLSTSLLVDNRPDRACFLVRLETPEMAPGLPRITATGLKALRLDPAQYLQVHAPDIRAMLCAAADIARCPAAGAVILEIHGNPCLIDLTATRRLALAAEKSGVLVLLLRINARTAPSAAYSRWQIRSAASHALPGNAPGAARFQCDMLRHRAFMPGKTAILEWNHDTNRFCAAAAQGPASHVTAYDVFPALSPAAKTSSGGVSAIPVRRPGTPQRKQAPRQAAG